MHSPDRRRRPARTRASGYPCGERKQIPLFSGLVLRAGSVPAAGHNRPFDLDGGIE
jgi:hypothetical protein